MSYKINETALCVFRVSRVLIANPYIHINAHTADRVNNSQVSQSNHNST